MGRLRARLAPLTVAWLCVHVAMTGTTLAAFAAEASLEVVCTCAHGADHGSCPMHRTRPDPARCQLTGTDDDLAGALMSVVGPPALPAASGGVSFEAPQAGPAGYLSPRPVDWISPPDTPPPRG